MSEGPRWPSATLEELVTESRLVVRSFDPAVLSTGDAARAVEGFARLERLAAAGKVVCAARAADGSEWQRGGYATPEHWLAGLAGGTVADAARALATSRRLGSCPGTDAGLRRGDLSVAQAAEVSSAAVADPSAEDGLVEVAQREPMARLREASLRVRAAADGRGAEKRARRHHRRRGLRFWQGDDGELRFSGSCGVLQGAGIRSAIERWRDAAFRAGRAEGRRDPFDATTLDALDLALQASLGHVPTLTDPTTPATDPADPADPTDPADPADPAAPSTDPAAPSADPAAPSADPAAPSADPAAPSADPAAPSTDPAAPSADPAAPSADPADPAGSAAPTRQEAAPAPTTPSTEPAAEPQDPPRPSPGGNTPTPRPSGSPRHKIIVHVSYQALLRGFTVSGEVCEVDGVGPLPVAQVHDLLAGGDAFLAAVLVDGVDVHKVVHIGRHIPEVIRTALEVRDRACVICGNTGYFEIDHTTSATGYSDTGRTMLDELGRLCLTDHIRKTHHGWVLVGGPGTWQLLPPEPDTTTTPTHGSDPTGLTRTGTADTGPADTGSGRSPPDRHAA